MTDHAEDELSPEQLDAMNAIVATVRHLEECLGYSADQAAHALLGCAVATVSELPSAAQLEFIDDVRQALDEREDELRGDAH